MAKQILSAGAKSLTEAVVEALRADILTCRLPPGTRLKIGDLCTRFSVSLGAVREALSHLAAEGLVVAETQRGFQVAPVSAEDLADLTATRIDIEGLALRRSIDNGDVGWESALVAAFHRLSRTPEREASDPLRITEAWATAHADFHRALVAGCGSLWLLKLRAMLNAQSERYRRLSVPVAKHDRDLEAEHRGIMEAALAHDASRAVQLLTEHLSATTRILLDAPEVKAGISGGTRSKALQPARRGAAEGLYHLPQDA